MQQSVYDTLIIGAGPAGTSCAVWLAQLGFSPIVLDAASQVGGLTAINPFEDAWNVTAPGLTGEEIAQRLKCSLDSTRVPVLLDSPVLDVVVLDTPEAIEQALKTQVLKYDEQLLKTDRLFNVIFGDGNSSLLTRFLVVATGVQPNATPEILANPSEHVLLGPGKHITRYPFATKKVAILGGGDNAFENAVYVNKMGADSVRIFARHLRSQQQWMNRVDPTCVSVGPYDFDPVAKTVNGEAFDVILVFYGYKAQLKGLSALNLVRTERGYVQVDMETARTSVPGVYAIGEVSNRLHPCIVTAMADGVTAAKAIQACIEEGPLSSHQFGMSRTIL